MLLSLILAIQINVVHFTENFSPDSNELHTILEKTKAIYEREFQGRRPKIKFKAYIQSYMPRIFSLGQEDEAYFQLTREIPGGVWLYVLPPLTENNGDRYIGGRAQVFCFKDKPSAGMVVFLQAENQRGESRINESAYVVAHEIAHIFNVHTDRDENAMTIEGINGAFWANRFGELPFSVKAKRTIKRCSNKKR